MVRGSVRSQEKFFVYVVIVFLVARDVFLWNKDRVEVLLDSDDRAQFFELGEAGTALIEIFVNFVFDNLDGVIGNSVLVVSLLKLIKILLKSWYPQDC